MGIEMENELIFFCHIKNLNAIQNQLLTKYAFKLIK
jgi:hypothetical protein